jgi:hypothetical protein
MAISTLPDAASAGHSGRRRARAPTSGGRGSRSPAARPASSSALQRWTLAWTIVCCRRAGLGPTSLRTSRTSPPSKMRPRQRMQERSCGVGRAPLGVVRARLRRPCSRRRGTAAQQRQQPSARQRHARTGAPRRLGLHPPPAQPQPAASRSPPRTRSQAIQLASRPQHRSPRPPGALVPHSLPCVCRGFTLSHLLSRPPHEHSLRLSSHSPSSPCAAASPAYRRQQHWVQQPQPFLAFPSDHLRRRHSASHPALSRPQAARRALAPGDASKHLHADTPAFFPPAIAVPWRDGLCLCVEPRGRSSVLLGAAAQL